jgi:hypothetical protein
MTECFSDKMNLQMETTYRKCTKQTSTTTTAAASMSTSEQLLKILHFFWHPDYPYHSYQIDSVTNYYI